jgi:hypothetical protein
VLIAYIYSFSLLLKSAWVRTASSVRNSTHSPLAKPCTLEAMRTQALFHRFCSSSIEDELSTVQQVGNQWMNTNDLGVGSKDGQNLFPIRLPVNHHLAGRNTIP